MFQFESFAAFVEMGGHGPYVWSAYVIALSLLASLVIMPLRRKRMLLKQIAREQRRAQAAQQRSEEV